ncbi:MAG: DUF1289 domain-containing protein [Xanthomonadaceae bacterium]|nr:DUF1289 domain-containing protein [Xanthomonadaceae bacterium]
MTDPERIASPCVRNCCLDEQDICLGCGRSLAEITAWSGSSDHERRAILERAAQRRYAGQAGAANHAPTGQLWRCLAYHTGARHDLHQPDTRRPGRAAPEIGEHAAGRDARRSPPHLDLYV